MKRKQIFHIVWIIVMILLSLIIITPILIMFFTSFKTAVEIGGANFKILPEQWNLDNYVQAMSTGNWPLYFKNSLTITIVAVVFSLLFNSIAGYAFARLNFPGKNLLFGFLLMGLMMPQQVSMLPTFLIMAKFPMLGGNDLFGNGGSGLMNTLPGLVIPLVSGSFGVFLCKQFYENFPKALDEAAVIDGAGKWRIYFEIYVPNSKVILATLSLLKGVSVWNDYLWPLVMTNNEGMRTVQLALSLFNGETTTDWGPMMAASVLVCLPMVLLFLVAQKYFVQGVVSTGLK
ncbi:MAG: carbohydrate ABC transporter permease [Eubacteriales bacterium]